MKAAAAFPPAAELRAIGAFVRRDVLMAWSYRTAFVSDAVMLFTQALLFVFVSRLIDPERVTGFGGTRNGYLAFVSVGIAVTTLLGVGLQQLTSVIRSERFMGTLEAVLMAPIRLTTLQLGWLAYDLLYVPIRTLIFLVIMAVGFGVPLSLGGTGEALVFLLLFVPFVWGIGSAAAAGTLVFRRGTVLGGVGAFGLTFLSGSYFPLELLPAWVGEAARFNPVALAVDGMRAVLVAGAGLDDLTPELLRLAAISTGCLAVGLALFQRALRRELRSGGIGLY